MAQTVSFRLRWIGMWWSERSGDHFLVPTFADFHLATLAWRKIRGKCPKKVVAA
ncbi:MAG: hypothetical protein ACPGWR_09350 [Ardenticatenaceae bacterium]